jgi:hypothetical protein
MKVMIIVKASPESETGQMPSDKELAEMTSFNEELVKAGVMLDGAGLTQSSKGARVRFNGKQRQVIDGPFSEAKELIAGFWVLEVKSLAEALEWAKRIPFQEGEVEVRPYHEMTDFADASPETIARNEKLAKATEERRRA